MSDTHSSTDLDLKTEADKEKQEYLAAWDRYRKVMAKGLETSENAGTAIGLAIARFFEVLFAIIRLLVECTAIWLTSTANENSPSAPTVPDEPKAQITVDPLISDHYLKTTDTLQKLVTANADSVQEQYVASGKAITISLDNIRGPINSATEGLKPKVTPVLEPSPGVEVRATSRI